MLRKPMNRPIFMQLLLAMMASFFLGLGLFFLYAWAGLPGSLASQRQNLLELFRIEVHVRPK